MQQVLFHVPVVGVPIYGFGVMLFSTFVLTAMLWGPRRAKQIGLPADRLQDLAVVLFLTGIAGARLTYMIQYYDRDFRGMTPAELVGAFFAIWNGGIVLYGSIVGGFLGYLVFRWRVLKPLGIDGWKLADVVAPLLAVGIAVGRLGCYLNGCCWGQPVCDAGRPAPLVAAAPVVGRFPLLPAHAREQVCTPARDGDRLPWVRGLQTSTGFAQPPREPRAGVDPRAVAAVEPGSAAEAAGLRAGDVITAANGAANHIVVEPSGPPEAVAEFARRAKGAAADGDPVAGRPTRLTFDRAADYDLAVAAAAGVRGLRLTAHDTLDEMVRHWRDDRKGVNRLDLRVQRPDGGTAAVAFVPRTVPFYPTQLYEAVSMLLLAWLLVEFQPFRRHDGQLMVMWMAGYAVHRYFNEAIRIEPTYALGLTLSQWMSAGTLLAAAGLEAYLRLTRPPLPPGPVPLGYGAAAADAEPPAAEPLSADARPVGA